MLHHIANKLEVSKLQPGKMLHHIAPKLDAVQNQITNEDCDLAYQCLSSGTISAPHLVPIENVTTTSTISSAFHANDIRAS